MFRIAIIGGGLGGLFAALSIHHHCGSQDVQIDVYEQAPEYKEIGAGVGIGPNAAALIEKLGLMEEARKIAGTRRHIWLSFRRYDNAEEVLTVMTPKEGNVAQLPMHRAEFLELLVRTIRVRGAATLHTNKRCEGIEDQGDTVLVTFADGTTTSANLVIGADGIHSVVRSHYVSDNPQFGGMVVYRGLCDMSKIKDQWTLPTYACVFVAPGKHFLTFPISSNKILNVVGFVSTPFENLGDVQESWTLAGDKGAVEEEFKDFAPIVQSVIRNMDTNPLKWILFDRNSSPEWIFAEGKVALLGDAAHAMCPHQGAGAGQALEDGYIIGRALHDYFQDSKSTDVGSVRRQLQLYHSIRFPRSEKVQVTSRQAGDLYQMKTPELAGLSYDDGLPTVKAKIENRMQWIWGEDLDEVYNRARAEWQHPGPTL
ncbi:uncharacterized protein BJX67DRAFT_371797 [Aspergillus lucknowensis]|uniref:FAD-binding domain-containing protein n=1 Tax=Aspergillus lucknowensis TaxID=176173 RepID=A0ABR4LTF9_9EURO